MGPDIRPANEFLIFLVLRLNDYYVVVFGFGVRLSAFALVIGFKWMGLEGPEDHLVNHG